MSYHRRSLGFISLSSRTYRLSLSKSTSTHRLPKDILTYSQSRLTKKTNRILLDFFSFGEWQLNDSTVKEREEDSWRNGSEGLGIRRLNETSPSLSVLKLPFFLFIPSLLSIRMDRHETYFTDPTPLKKGRHRRTRGTEVEGWSVGKEGTRV